MSGFKSLEARKVHSLFPGAFPLDEYGNGCHNQHDICNNAENSKGYELHLLLSADSLRKSLARSSLSISI